MSQSSGGLAARPFHTSQTTECHMGCFLSQRGQDTVKRDELGLFCPEVMMSFAESPQAEQKLRRSRFVMWSENLQYCFQSKSPHLSNKT